MVNTAGTFKEAELHIKAARVELDSVCYRIWWASSKNRWKKINLDKLKLEKDISAFEQSLEDAKAKVDSKAKVLEEMKAVDAAQSEIENAKKFTDAQLPMTLFQ